MQKKIMKKIVILGISAMMGMIPVQSKEYGLKGAIEQQQSILEESIFQDKNKEEAQNVDMKTRVYVEMYDDKGTEYMEWVPLQLDVAWLLDNKPDKILAAFRWTDSEGTQWAVTYNKTNFWLTKFPPAGYPFKLNAGYRLDGTLYATCRKRYIGREKSWHEGVRREYDTEGNVIKEVDKDEPFRGYSWEQLKHFLEVECNLDILANDTMYDRPLVTIERRVFYDSDYWTDEYGMEKEVNRETGRGVWEVSWISYEHRGHMQLHIDGVDGDILRYEPIRKGYADDDGNIVELD